jgi:glutathione S-transferase
MYDLYIANKNYSSWSLRPWVLMRELDIGFNEKLVPFVDPGQPNPFTTFSPTGKVPCLVDGVIVVWDSLAITEYLAERHPQVWPADAATRAWARCASAEMHSGFSNLRSVCSMNCGIRVRIHDFSEGVLKDVARIDALWNEGLSRFGGPFLTGRRFTAVDAFYAPVAFRFQTYTPPLSEGSSRYAQHLLALPSMRAWYDAALREPWREIEHERETLDHGALLEDLRTG